LLVSTTQGPRETLTVVPLATAGRACLHSSMTPAHTHHTLWPTLDLLPYAMQSLRLHIQVAPLSVRRALELDTTAFLDAVKESHDLESRGLTPAEPPPASRVVPRPPQPPAAAAGRDA
jgi:hypothetical protein